MSEWWRENNEVPLQEGWFNYDPDDPQNKEFIRSSLNYKNMKTGKINTGEYWMNLYKPEYLKAKGKTKEEAFDYDIARGRFEGFRKPKVDYDYFGKEPQYVDI